MRVKWKGVSGEDYVLDGVFITLRPLKETSLLLEMTVNEQDKYLVRDVEVIP